MTKLPAVAPGPGCWAGHPCHPPGSDFYELRLWSVAPGLVASTSPGADAAHSMSRTIQVPRPNCLFQEAVHLVVVIVLFS